MILQAHPMFLFYLNDHRNENHASPSAHLFFLKFFTSLNYPMLVSHFFRPFHPMVNSSSSYVFRTVITIIL